MLCTRLYIQSFRNYGADEAIGRSRGGTVDLAANTNLISICRCIWCHFEIFTILSTTLLPLLLQIFYSLSFFITFILICQVDSRLSRIAPRFPAGLIGPVVSEGLYSRRQWQWLFRCLEKHAAEPRPLEQELSPEQQIMGFS
ncbi:hypothetical protein Y032_0156g3152 [Ancylostoma ceylanicum]|uniref:Uncharacterized protein n=1 Tax=Ancylostoma ceylanicum TaxID=53326 RepID=A0A016SZ94_9BILA|nr:hypothetical protein Y032_0156g3152 [Ancylostoma ceylanicum]